MSSEEWIAGSGVGLTWTSAITASVLNTIANGNAIASDVVISNGTALDIFCDVSIAFGSITAAAPAYIGIYLYPLNKDASTYGDSRFASSAAGPPPPNYFVGSIGFPTGTAAITGSLTKIVMPPGSFKFVVFNQAGVALAGSGGNTMSYRTYNRAIV